MISRRRVARGVAGFLLLVSLAPLGRRVEAATIAIPAPNPMDILCGDKKLGTLEITKYESQTNANNTVGAGIVAKFVKSDPTMTYNFKWLQAVTDGKGTIGQGDGTAPPYLDPYDSGPGGTREDNLPWYWTEVENMRMGDGSGLDGANGTNGPGTLFSDYPKQAKGNSGNFIKFEAALVCVNGLNISYLKGFTWGYKVNADMTSTADPFVWLNAPTASLTGPTVAWDGTTNQKGGGTPVGYKFSATCNCPCTPEPSSMVLCLIGTVGWAAGARRRHYRMAA
jgi:hypothetical protein